MVQALFEILGEIATQFGTLLTSIFTSVIQLIYTAGAGDAAGTFTPFGIIVLVGLGTGLLIWGLNFLLRFIRVGDRRAS